MPVRNLQRALLALVASALFGVTTPARAEFTFSTLDAPSASPGGTVPNDVEGSRIVGTFRDVNGASHGFVYDGTTWTTLDHPDAAAPRGTEAFGVSDGLICGSYVDVSGQTLGFLYDGTNWTTLAHPPVGLGPVDTFATGLSDGTLVGYYIEALVARGFVYRNGTFSDLVVPGSLGTFPQDVDGTRIGGTFDDPVGTHGFVFDGLQITPLDHPLGTLGTFVNGVDDGNLVGNYVSLVDGASHGFLFDGATFTPIDFPGATDTTATGISGSRVVGTYTDAAGVSHGFVAVVPEPTGAAAVVVAVASAVLRRRRPVDYRCSSNQSTTFISARPPW